MAESASPAHDNGTGKSSLKTLLLSGLLAIALGASSGFAVGYFTYVAPPAETTLSDAQTLTDQSSEASSEQKTEAVGEPAKPTAGDHGKSAEVGAKPAEGEHEAAQANAGNIALEPIVTNLADPEDMWIRLELVLASAEPLEPDLILQIHEDLFAFVHAMHLSEMTGPSALIDLKSELLARSRQRSGGLIKKIYIKTLLFE